MVEFPRPPGNFDAHADATELKREPLHIEEGKIVYLEIADKSETPEKLTPLLGPPSS